MTGLTVPLEQSRGTILTDAQPRTLLPRSSEDAGRLPLATEIGPMYRAPVVVMSGLSSKLEP